MPDLSPVAMLNYSRIGTNGAPLAYNVFLFGGETYQRFSLDRATNIFGSAWTTGPTLEIFDGAGTLFYVETISGTNIPPKRAISGRLIVVCSQVP